MPKSIVRRISNIDVELYGENTERLVTAHSIFKRYIYEHRITLDKTSLKRPPFVTKEGNDSTKQTFIIFIDSKNEGNYLKALQELGTACLMWSGLNDENVSMFLVDEPEVAERAAKNIGITITPEDYVTVKFVDAGLPEPASDIEPELRVGRGVGEMLVFAIGFKGFLEENELTLKNESIFEASPMPIPPEDLRKHRESCQATLAFASLWRNEVNSEVSRGGNNAE